MLLGLIMALAAALCFGVAMVLQALGAQRRTPRPGEGVLGTARAMLNVAFAAGLLLDCFGFGAQLLALRTLPLYVVQAALAGALAVTAVLGAAVLKARLGRGEWLGVAGVCLGLAVLGVTAGAEGHKQPAHAFHWILLVVVAVIAGLGGVAWRLREPTRAAVMGGLCGLGFGVVGLAVRVLSTSHGLATLFADPALYALLAGGAVSFVLMTEGVRGGKVTIATAGMVLGETALPAVLGVVLLGDGTRHGLMPLAVAGFAVAVAGALALARFGEISSREEEAAASPTPHPAPASR